MMRWIIGSLGVAALAAIGTPKAPPPVSAWQNPALVEHASCKRGQEWSIRVRPRATVRAGAALPLEVALSAGPSGGTFRVSLRAPAGTLTLEKVAWDETLAPNQTVVRTIEGTCDTSAPVTLVAKLERLDAGFQRAIPAQHAVRLLPLPDGVSGPASLGWDAASGRAPGTPGEEHVRLRSGETVLLVPAHR